MELKHINRSAITIAEKHNLETEEAMIIMKESTVWIFADMAIKTSHSKQLTFLTALNIAKRVFLGGVYCVLPRDVPNLLRIESHSFNDLVEAYGGIIIDKQPSKNVVKILVGLECFDDYCVEAVSAGWRGGIIFYDQARITFGEIQSRVSLGSVASASMACYFAFCKTYKISIDSSEQNVGLSFWNLNSGEDWYLDENDGPRIVNLPRNIWALGLGHLGQAYIWTLGLMPFSDPKETIFLLQDADIVNTENIGSQVLCNDWNIGRPKTRACLDFLERLNFKTQIIEKPFISGDSEQEWLRKYSFLLNAVDNGATRRSIQKSTLGLFLDGATNGSTDLFDSFTMKNVSNIEKDPDDLWKEDEMKNSILHKNLYEKFEKRHQCGQMANIGISTPFVGIFGSVVIISELLRSINKGRMYSIVTLQMRDLMSIEAVECGFYNKDLLRFAI